MVDPSLIFSRSTSLQNFQGCTSFTCKDQILQLISHACIYHNLDEQYIKHIIKYFINHNTWNRLNTRLEEEFSLLKISEWDKSTTQLLRQGILCNQRTLSSVAPRFLKIYHQHNFDLQYRLNSTHPKVSIYILGKIVISKAGVVEIVGIVKD